MNPPLDNDLYKHLDLMKAQADAGLKNSQVAEFAWLVKNWVRPLGFFALRLALSVDGNRYGVSLAVAAAGRNC